MLELEIDKESSEISSLGSVYEKFLNLSRMHRDCIDNASTMFRGSNLSLRSSVRCNSENSLITSPIYRTRSYILQTSQNFGR